MTESTVRRQLGNASRKLDRDHWIYDRFEALPGRPVTADCSTLLIVFFEGRVSDLKLLNERAEKIISAKLNTRRSSPLVTNTEPRPRAANGISETTRD